ncbi:MAG TPA: DEAD/DEAH box helicase family protein, partial [Myxococcota bacterium]|nr:DEAD/DEAH box helicase family protein [Myxococcota bacterium]
MPLHLPAPRKVRFWSELSGPERQQWLAEAEALAPSPQELLLRNGDVDPAFPYAHILLLPRPDRVAEAPARSYHSRQSLALGAPEDPFLQHLLPLIPTASRIEVVAAFVQPRGLQLLSDHLQDALEHGAQVQILTGDYLGIASADALQLLWDWQQQQPGLQVRVMEYARLQRAFHPKAWRIHRPEGGIGYVGSSNISHSALVEGVEWNLRLEAAQQPEAWQHLGDAIAQTWTEALPLESAWIAAYRRRARPAALPAGLAESPEPPPQPRDLQQQALAALQQAREIGKQRVLVVLATGLGKTLLAAFDVARILPRRCLVLAHRAELLEQAARAFRRLHPQATFSWMVGASADAQGDIVFASTQKLSRVVESLPAEHFDYILVDEVHHAMAQSYRRILAHFPGAFVLGLTATPERADQLDLRSLFDGGIAFRADLGLGIHSGALVPFHYRGIRDTVHYQPLPWRNGRFDLAALEEAVQTQERMERLWQEWRGGGRSLVFCCSLSHARFVQRWLRDKGLRVAMLHGGL